MVECQICHKKVDQITYFHLKIHNISFKDYRQMFPDAITIDDTIRKKQSTKKIGKAPWNKGLKCPQFAGENNSSKRPEVKLKISESLKNSEKHKDAINSDQWKERQRESHLGKKLTEEHKIKIGIGVKNSEKYQEAIKNPIHSKNLSKAQMGHIGYMRGKTHSNETIEQMRKAAYNRNTDEYKKQISNSVKLLWQDDEYKQKQLDATPQRSIKCSKAMKGKLPSNNGYGKGCYYNSLLQGKIWLRSSYELKFAQYLDKNNISWLYEIQTFDLGETTYTPDFFLPTCNLFIEIKGYMTDKAQEKINKFLDIYNDETLQILRKNDLIKLGVDILDRN